MKRGDSSIRNPLLQLRVFCFGLLQDRDVGIGVFPESEEILIRGAGLGCLSLQSVRTTELEVRKSTDWLVQHNSPMIQDFLKLGRGFTTLVRRKIGFPAHIDGI